MSDIQTMKMTMPEALNKIEKLQARIDEMELAINSHNKECDDMCDPKRCGYAKYNKQCPECPKDWRIGDE